MRASSQHDDAERVRAGRGLDAAHLLGRQRDRAVVRERREVVEAVRVGDEAVVAEGLADLLHPAVQVADVGRAPCMIRSPSTSSTMRSTPWVEGWDGPMLRTIRSPDLAARRRGGCRSAAARARRARGGRHSGPPGAKAGRRGARRGRARWGRGGTAGRSSGRESGAGASAGRQSRNLRWPSMGKSRAERPAVVVLGHVDAREVRVPLEGDPEHVVGLALGPVRGPEERRERRHRPALGDPGLERSGTRGSSMLSRTATTVKRGVAVGVVDGGVVHEAGRSRARALQRPRPPRPSRAGRGPSAAGVRGTSGAAPQAPVVAPLRAARREVGGDAGGLRRTRARHGTV